MSLTFENFLAAMTLSNGCSSAAKRTGAVAKPRLEQPIHILHFHQRRQNQHVTESTLQDKTLLTKEGVQVEYVPQVCGGRLPEQLRVLREVKPVVDELERDPQVLPEGEGRVDEEVVFRGKRTERIFDKLQPCASFSPIILQIIIYINSVT